MKILSLFANVGFGEFYLRDEGFDVAVANELLEDRVDFYKKLHPDTQSVICGDISQTSIQNSIIESCNKFGPIDVVVATPPCQGMSLANASKASDDPRNTLIIHALDIFNKVGAKYMLIENVTNMPNTYIHHKDYGSIQISEFIKKSIPTNLKSHSSILNGKHFDTPQDRRRSITLISPDGSWKFPKINEEETSLESAISHLPSLKPAESSGYKWHFSSKHNPNHMDWMRNTPSGQSAYFNELDHYPCSIIENSSSDTKLELIKNGNKGWHKNPPIVINGDGSKCRATINQVMENGKCVLYAEIPPNCSLVREIYGFTTAYKRMNWLKSAPTVTMTNGSISSQNNVHPGREIKGSDGLYSDARVLTVREVLLVCGLPPDILDRFAHEVQDGIKYEFTSGKYGYDYSPSFIRKVLGELFLPKVCLAIMKSLPKDRKRKANNPTQLEFNYA